MEFAACAESDPIADWLRLDTWPFHGSGAPPKWFGPDIRSFWILEGGDRVGFARLFDLDDPTPLFDLRIRSASRGRGLGRAALRWLTSYVFRTFPEPPRFAGYTRSDNLPMRRVFEACGFLQEAYYRRSWRSPDGYHDTVGYGVLREEWPDILGV